MAYLSAIMQKTPPMKPETAAIHVPDRRYDGAVAPPIHLTTTFEHGAAANELTHGYLYVRHGAPNISDLEARIAALEGGAACVAFASGMAAAAAVLGTLRPGERAVLHRDLYFDVKTLAREELPLKNIKVDFADLADPQTVADALSSPASLVWIETPTNPMLDIIDIAAVAKAALRAGAKLMVDTTFASPALQNPLALGADYVMHSATKYMGGHSDVQGGAIAVRDANDAEALLRARKLSGAALSPFNAWLISRGLQTLHCRMEKHCANAAIVANFLENHEAVATVRYPFLESHPGAAIARRQMKAGGGMVSAIIKGGREGALGVARRLSLIVNATSLGGVESLVEHRASLEGPETTTPQGLLRFSIGIEHPDDLIADLRRALDSD